jgi:hypothetical protein
MNESKIAHNFRYLGLKEAITRHNLLFELWIFRNDALDYSYASYQRQKKAFFDFIIDFALSNHEDFFFWNSIWHGDKKEIAFKERCRHYSYKEAITLVRKHETTNSCSLLSVCKMKLIFMSSLGFILNMWTN